jgi:pre-mRNA-splicing factor 18
MKWVRKWCFEWKTDLDSRPEHAAITARGKRAYRDFCVTMKAFEHFFLQLKQRTLKKELKDGLWPIIKAIKERNYLHANTILLNAIAIGNSPWPIGVTQVGIHTKSAARERISTIHTNKNAAAHIMSDEATRKTLHGLKRLLTVMQRLYPTTSFNQCNAWKV